MTDDDLLLDAIARNVIGLPLAVCDWRDLVRLRDTLDDLVNRAVNERQSTDLPGGGPPPLRRPAAPPARRSERTTP